VESDPNARHSMRAACLLSALGSLPLHMMALVVALAIRDGAVVVAQAGWFSASFMLGLTLGAIGLPALGARNVSRKMALAALLGVVSALAIGPLVGGGSTFACWIAVGIGCSVLNLLGTTYAAAHAERQRVLRLRMSIVLAGASLFVLGAHLAGGFVSYASLVAMLAAAMAVVGASGLGWYMAPAPARVTDATAPAGRRVPYGALVIVVAFFAGQPGFTAYAAHIAATHGIHIDALPIAYAVCKGVAALVLLRLSADRGKAGASDFCLSLLLGAAVATIAFAADIRVFVFGLLAWEIAVNLLSTRFQAALLARHPAFAGPWLPALIAVGAGLGPVVHGWTIAAQIGVVFVVFSIGTAFLPLLWMQERGMRVSRNDAAFGRRPPGLGLRPASHERQST